MCKSIRLFYFDWEIGYELLYLNVTGKDVVEE
jgi:hypothetical protein